MHRILGFLSSRMLHIRRGETQKVFLTFLYFFLVITAYYVIKPVSRSLVLGELGSRFVPYVDLITAILMGPFVALFARLVDRIDKRRLVSAMFWAVTGSLLVFWQLLRWHTAWVPGLFYVWVSIFSVLVVTLFWLVANDLYHAHEAKRLFGFIGSGGILGGVLGSSIAATGAKLIGTEQLLILSAALLALCWVVVERLWQFVPDSPIQPNPAAAHAASKRAPPGEGQLVSTARQLARSRYLLLLVALVGIAKIVSTLIYYQFNPFIEQMFPDPDMKTAFTGLFFGWMNIASFLVQFLFTSLILRRLGVGIALLLLPVGLLAGSVGLLAAPLFWIAAGAELFDGAMNYSLQQTSKEVLYLPIDRSARYKIKPFIDMVVFRFGKGIAAILGILWLDVWHLPSHQLSLVTVPLIALWIVVAIQLRFDYTRTIRRALQARAVRRRAWETASPFQERKLRLATELLAVDGALPDGATSLLDSLMQHEHRLSGRRDAIKAIAQRHTQEAVDRLLGMLMVEEDAVMRRELVRGLMKLRLRRSPRMEFPKRIIRRQIHKDVQAHRRVAQVIAAYEAATARTTSAGDPVLRLLRVILEESTEQIFRLLSLLHRPEDIHLIYNQLRESDPHLRADAIELLDNVVDPGINRLIAPVLDEDERLGHDEGAVGIGDEAYATLRQGIHDHNHWLGVVTLCVVGRLRLEPLLGELEWAQSSESAFIRQAAHVARQFAGLS